MPSWAHIDSLAVRVGRGEHQVWTELMAALDPKLQVLVRYQRIGRLRSREDDLRNIVVAVFEKLRRDDFRVLRRFAGMQGRPSFEAWIRRVLRSVAIDYLRGHAEYRRHAGSDGGSSERWVSLEGLTTGAARQPLDSAAEKRRQVLDELASTIAACAAVRAGEADADTVAAELGVEPIHVQRVIDRGERMQAVVELLFQGHRHDAIAHQLKLTRRQVELALTNVEHLLVARWSTGGADESNAHHDESD